MRTTRSKPYADSRAACSQKENRESGDHRLPVYVSRSLNYLGSFHNFMSQEPQTRRGFYVAAINMLGAAIAAAVAIPAAAYLLIRPKNTSDGNWIEVGSVDQLRPGKPEQVLYERKYVDGWKKVTEKTSVWLVKNADQSITAFNPACTHLACPYHWVDERKQFVCPCHDSVFSIDGKVLGGPAPRPLDRYLTKIEDGKVSIGSQAIEQG